ncbi:MAG: hydrogenase 4 subunit F, partial [Deinococcus sp.]|nr:hydrogenase 4 subunit F [Deinococcus sp.]
LEAAWKFIFLSSVGIAFALLGIIFLHYAASLVAPETLETLDWATLKRIAPELSPALARLAFIFILIGYGTKTGLAPMHTWLPDAHSQAPTPVSALLSGALLNTALYAILRLAQLLAPAAGEGYVPQLLQLFGLLSVAVATPFILVQQDLKRLLAYSSIEHMGLITFGLGLASDLGRYGALFHILNHSLAKALMFFAAGLLVQHYGSRQLLKLRGAASSLPPLGFILAAGTLALIGLPPFGLFSSEFLMIRAALASGQVFQAGALLFLLLCIFAGFIYALGVLSQRRERSEAAPHPRLPRLALATTALVLVPLLVLGVYVPQPLNSLLSKIAALLG